ncbi:hypothetical protein GCM10010389_52620 [Streptomyces echinoruber]|uniref:Uncharacterized protein n=1 Tax=Streptomyces echinoruber TaxID=68898 RepID=A0A918VJJ8_9ACTN|nr:hypothetical protein GCM10010389_52620 [Streptomyces echinoruber]
MTWAFDGRKGRSARSAGTAWEDPHPSVRRAGRARGRRPEGPAPREDLPAVSPVRHGAWSGTARGSARCVARHGAYSLPAGAAVEVVRALPAARETGRAARPHRPARASLTW